MKNRATEYSLDVEIKQQPISTLQQSTQLLIFATGERDYLTLLLHLSSQETKGKQNQCIFSSNSSASRGMSQKNMFAIWQKC
jgi:hypothetical protein